MKIVRKIVNLAIIALTIFSLAGCSKQTSAVKNENKTLTNTNSQLTDKVKELEDKISQLENDISEKEKENKEMTDKLAKAKEAEVVIDYVSVYDNGQYAMYDKKAFVEKEHDIYALPSVNSYITRHVGANTVVRIIDKGIVNDEKWVYVLVSTLDSLANNRGWIKESDTTEYTTDKMKLVLNPVNIKNGADAYQTENFEDIKATNPTSFNNESGAIMEKRDGYYKIALAGGRVVWVKESDIVYPEVN